MTEEWRPIPSLPGYEASSEGQIRHGHRILRGAVDRYGYRYFNVVGAKKRKAHRLVCEAFHGPARGRQCAHWDGDKSNNAPRNLRWATQAENAQDSVRLGTIRVPRQGGKGGERHPSAKLTEAQARAILDQRGNGSLSQVAAGFGISRHTVWNIWSGRLWQHLASPSGSNPSAALPVSPADAASIAIAEDR